jgi:hypothetical protein
MKTHPKQMVWPDPIIGYRDFVDGISRAIFEDTTGQYIMVDNGERIYGTYLSPDLNSLWPVILKPLPTDYPEIK